MVLALGPGSPLAGMLLVATMLNVHSGHAGNGPWNSDVAWELPLPFGPIDATLGFTREATLAFDAGLRWDFRGDRWGLAAIAAGLAGGSIPLLTRRRAASGQAAESATTTA